MKEISEAEVITKLGKFINAERIPFYRGHGLSKTHKQANFENGKVFVSYSMPCAYIVGNKLYLKGCHDVSKTTSSFLTSWCGVNTADRRKGLENNKFTLVV